PAGELPDEPGVDGTEEDLALLRALPQAGQLVQQPTDLGSGEVGREWQPGRGAEPVGSRVAGQFPDDAVGAGVLPHDRRVYRLPGRFVPQQRGLALVGDAHRGQVGAGQAGLVERAAGDCSAVVPDLGRVVVDPAGAGVALAVLALVERGDPAVGVEDDAAGRGGALVDGGDVVGR